MDLLAIAKKAADRVEAASVANKVPVAVCVIDIHGNVVLQHPMTRAPVFSIELSKRKAYTSALVGMRTADILPLVQPGQSLYPLSIVSEGRFCAMGGGAPLTSEGKIVAGVGVSGGTVDQDVGILESALREVGQNLPQDAPMTLRRSTLDRAGNANTDHRSALIGVGDDG